jgi:hypothetical protein
MNVNEKGNIGLTETISDLTKKGYYVYLPVSDDSPIDLIVLDNTGNTKRLQVKYRSVNESGLVEVRLRSVVNGINVPIDTSLIDGWSIYIPEEDVVIYVPKTYVGDKKSFSIRVLEAKQKQIGESTSFKEFLDETLII